MKSDAATYLVGSGLPSGAPLPPYSDLAIDFLAELSRELLSVRAFPPATDVVAFAFWCRRANLKKLKAEFEDGRPRLGLGLVFHVAPSNVPTNFAFSFAIGLLAGNANLVRVPSRPLPQVDVIVGAIHRLLKQDRYLEIALMTAFVRYEVDDGITELFSSNCRARVVWGSDETVRAVRKTPIPVRSVDLAFSDRYSFCVMHAPSVLKLRVDELHGLARRFYNDAYLMDQNACASPHLVVWCGEQKEAARDAFWSALSQRVADEYRLAAVQAVDKYVQLCNDAISLEQLATVNRHGNHIYRVQLDGLPADMSSLRGRFGYFYEYDTDDLNTLKDIVNAKYQTVTFFGLEKSTILDFVLKNRLAGIDRIVEIGKALEMSTVWDGYDVVRTLSRLIDTKG